jgi:hypothetical protein
MKEPTNAVTVSLEGRQQMHFPIPRALAAVISASVLAIGVALGSGSRADHTPRAAVTTKATTLGTDSLPVMTQTNAHAFRAHHPGDGSDRRDRQSVFVHLVGLCAVLECDLAHVPGALLLSHRGSSPDCSELRRA